MRSGEAIGDGVDPELRLVQYLAADETTRATLVAASERPTSLTAA